MSSGFRLGQVCAPSDGKRQVLLTGNAIVDWFYVDEVVGALPLVDALAELAIARRFDIVATLGADCTLRFPRPHMEEEFNKLVRRKSQDPEAPSASSRSFGLGSRRSGPTEGGAVGQVEARAERSAIGALELVTRLLSQSKKRAFVVFDQPENLWPTSPTPDSVRLLEVVSRWAEVAGGSHESRTVLIVKADRLEEFRAVSARAFDASTFRRELTLEAPSDDEISAFLSRASLRHGLMGSPHAVAKTLAPRNELLRTIAERLAQLSAGGQAAADLADLCAAGQDPKALESARSALEALVGLQAVKTEVHRLVELTRLATRELREGRPGSPQASHMLFLGRPGTGKTEVARLLGPLLHAAGVRRRPDTIEISLQDVSSGHNPGECVEKMRTLIDRAMGGVLFVDEAYLIAEDQWASQALQTLMKVMEDRRGDLTVILAGYTERLASLDRVNPGFLSRIPFRIQFPDFTPDELGEIFRRYAMSHGHAVDDSVIKRVRRIAAYRAQKGASGNGRWVRQLFEKTDRLRAVRGGGALTAELVPDPMEFEDHAAQASIDALGRDLVGLSNVREHLNGLLLAQRDSRDHGLPPRATPRYLFIGAPGTGKTTVARRMAEALYRLGVTESPTLYESSFQDFSSVFTGGYAEVTRQKFAQARGAVLFIDEAYRLAEDEQGRRVLSQVVQHCTDPEYADVVVILAGYQRAMEELLAVNPGLRSRFPDRIDFADISNDALLEVVLAELHRRGLVVRPEDDLDFRRRVLTALSGRRPAPDFANARTAVSLCDEILTAQRARRAANAGLPPLEVRKEDVPTTLVITSKGRAAVDTLDTAFVGMASVKQRLQGLLKLADLRRRQLEAGMSVATQPNLNMVFMGGPGTGKTMVARWLTRALHEIGLVPSPRVAETRAIELKGTHVGEAQEKVQHLFRDHRGGVIVIDEAHSIRGGALQDVFARDIVTAIVGCVTAPEAHGTVVILAGYPKDMQDLLDSDPGLRGRFPQVIAFPDISNACCIDIVFSTLRTRGYQWEETDEIGRHLQRVFDVRRARPSFANARDAVQVVEAVVEQMAERTAEDSSAPVNRLEPGDFLGAM